MSSPQAKLQVDDDGLFCPDVGSWAETKYRLVALYSELFATGMKNKWGKRVYIDLYAGAGYSRIQGTSTILKSSPVLALTVRQPFDNYIFCEQDGGAMGALEKRTARIAPGAAVKFVAGDKTQREHGVSGGCFRNEGADILNLCLAVDGESTRIDDAMGGTGWRARWKQWVSAGRISGLSWRKSSP